MSDDKQPQTQKGAGGAKRPQSTLDLKAQHTGSDAPRTGDGAPPARKGAAAGALTYLAAGLAGGLAALVIGFYAIDGFRDSLPFVSEQSADQIRQDQAELERRLDELARETAEARAALGEQVGALDARTEGLVRADDASLSALAARVEALEQELRADAPDPATADQITTIEQRLTEMDARTTALGAAFDRLRAQSAENVAQARAAALAVALANLRRAIDNGDPFEPELETLRRLSSAELETPVLSEAAADGVPTLRALRDSFPGFARNALKAAGETGSSSIIGQIVDSARSVVNVRPVGEIEGDGPGAVIARIENRLQAGELAAAIAHTDDLSGEAAVQLLPWVQQARTRIEADREMSAIETRVLTAIQG